MVPFSRWISSERVISWMTSEKWRVLSVGSAADVLVLPCCEVSWVRDQEPHHGIALPDNNVVRLLDGVNVRGEVLVNLMGQRLA